MKTTQIVMLCLALTFAGIAAAPTAVAGPPECLQVNPWSALCEGNGEEFLCYFLGDIAFDPDPGWIC
jgi:hypothetical protein